MDASSTSNVENAERNERNATASSGRLEGKIPSMEQLELMVTPEQVHSASVAKKRRTITRKRTNDLNKARSQTPLRPQQRADETTPTSTDDEDVRKQEEPRRRPKLTERGSDMTAKGDANDTIQINVKTDEPIKPKVTELPLNRQPQKLADVPSEDEVKKDPVTGEVLKKRMPQKLAETPDDEDEEKLLTGSKNLKESKNLVTLNSDLEKSGSPKKFEMVDDSTQLSVTKSVETPVLSQPDIALRSKSKPKTKRPDSGSASASASERQSVTSDYGHQDRASSIPRQLEEQIQKLDNFVTTNTQELKHLFQKAKSTVEEKSKELRRRKFKKSDDFKRSQSQPKELSQEEIMESFKRAQKASRERHEDRIRSLSERRYSSGSEKSLEIPEKSEPKRPVRKRVLVQDIIKEKKAEKKRQIHLKDVKCNKIVEVLDPKTSKVIEIKNVGEVTEMRCRDVFKIFRFYSIREIIKEYRKYKVDMNEEYNCIRRLRRKCINHLLVLFIFCGLGGIVFKYIEGAFENFYKCGVKRVKRDFIELLWTKSHNLREEEWKSLARNKLRIFEEELHTAHEAGIHSYSGERSWSFLNGIVYCLTVVTTIGYGHLYPTTKTGQALTIVYSLIGIPLFLIILTDFGKMFTRCIKFLWSFVRRLYYTGSCRKMRKTAQAQELFKGAQMMYEIATFRRPSQYDPNLMQAQAQAQAQAGSPHGSTEGTTAPPTPAISNFEIDDEFNLPISVAILLLVLYIFLGAVLFGIWEGWDFFASFYFVFISMSTIGFGDYVPRHPFFMIVSIVYIVFGLALMSMCINVVQVKLSDTFNQASAKIGATIGLGVTNEDGTIKPVPPKHVEMPAVHGSVVDLHKLSTPNTSMC